MDGHTIDTTLSPDHGRIGQGTQSCEASAKIPPEFLQSSLSSLDRSYPQISTWSKKEKRVYSCALSGLKRSLAQKKPVFFLTLTSAPGTGGLLAHDWDLLVKRIRRALGFKFEFMKVETSEGNGVIHCLFHSAFEGWKYADIHAWFSKIWLELHRSPVVWCTAVRFDKTKRIAGYMVQYVSCQGGFLRRSTSRSWIFRGWRGLMVSLIQKLGFLKGIAKWNYYLSFYSPSSLSFSQSNLSLYPSS